MNVAINHNVMRVEKLLEVELGLMKATSIFAAFPKITSMFIRCDRGCK